MGDTHYVVFHDAYQYFEKRFGLAPVGAIALSDASKPSPARLAELRAALIEQEWPVCLQSRSSIPV